MLLAGTFALAVTNTSKMNNTINLNTNPNFPLDLTPEEQERGFSLVTTKLVNDNITVAGLRLTPSARLIKVRDFKMSPADTGIGYSLEVYGCDTHFMRRGMAKPEWTQVRTYSTLEAALRLFRSEPLDPNLEVQAAPNDG